MSIDMIAEVIVAVLLAVTIAFCFQLNRRLGALRAEQEAMSDLVTGLNQATERAQDGIFQLRAASQGAEETLKKEVSRARALADELSLITEAGGNLAERIEAGLTSTRRGQSAPVEPFVQAEARRRPRNQTAAHHTENAKSDDIRRALSAAR